MYLEEYVVGETAELGSYVFTAEEIVAFASKYDPQPFHLSHEAGKAGPFKGLAASGWHTAAVWMKLMISFQIGKAKALMAEGKPVGRSGPSPGFTDMRWRKPVYAGDTLTYYATVLETKASQSRPGWGVLKGRNFAVNQDGVEVFEFTSVVFMETRPNK